MSKIDSKSTSASHVKTNSPMKKITAKNNITSDLNKILGNSSKSNYKSSKSLAEILAQEKINSLKKEEIEGNSENKELANDIFIEENLKVETTSDVKDATFELNEKDLEKENEKIEESLIEEKKINDRNDEKIIDSIEIKSNEGKSTESETIEKIPVALKKRKNESPMKMLPKVLENGSPMKAMLHRENNKINNKPNESKNSKELSYNRKTQDMTSKSVNRIISPLKNVIQGSSKKLLHKEESKDEILTSIDQVFTDRNVKIMNKEYDKNASSKNSTENNIENRKLHKNVNESSSSPVKIYNTFEKELPKENVNKKNETIYDQFYKIANKPRAELSPDKEAQKRRSPSRTAEQIDSMLYEDALRRASIHYESTEYAEICTSIKSQKVIAKKFIKDFSENLEKLEISPDKIDKLSMISLLKSLNFIKSDTEVNIPEKENALIHKF